MRGTSVVQSASPAGPTSGIRFPATTSRQNCANARMKRAAMVKGGGGSGRPLPSRSVLSKAR
eukprot:1145584-Prorocentrum_minimum.AAC.3